MLVPERRRLVLEHVRHYGSAQVGELADRLGVSAWTVRRDLDELELAGELLRTHGGAVAKEQGWGGPASAAALDPLADGSAAKTRIAARAAELLPDNGTIMLLGGTTTQALIPHLRRRRLTVVTNGLHVAAAFESSPEVTVVMLGGYLHRDQMTFVGAMTEASLANLHIDVMIGGAWGVDPDAGVTGNKVIQAGDHHRMLGHAEQLVVLADASKIGRRGPVLLAAMEHVHTLITDSGASSSAVDRLRRAGPHVVVA